MIIRRYGNRFHSVSLDFDPAAMTEVGFRKDGVQEWEAGEFLAAHRLAREVEIIAESSDPVQEKAEREMLEALEARFNEIHGALEEGQYLGIESKTGVDYPRTRYARPTTGNREFTYTMDRPLRLGIWEKRPV
jgi:hypothetical protein